MKIWVKDWRTDDRIVRFKPWFPRVYSFAGLTRFHWLFWILTIESGEAEQ